MSLLLNTEDEKPSTLTLISQLEPFPQNQPKEEAHSPTQKLQYITKRLTRNTAPVPFKAESGKQYSRGRLYEPQGRTGGDEHEPVHPFQTAP